MKKFIVEGTQFTPRVELDPAGEIVVRGRSIIEDPIAFFNPIFTWVKNCSMDKLQVTIRMEYMNTASSKQMYDFLMLISENKNINKINVSWYYEEGDEDCYEMGKDFELLMNLSFEYFEYAETM